MSTTSELITSLLPLLAPLPIPLAAVAVFSGAETALFSLSYQDRLKLERQSPAAARAVTFLLARPRATLILILFLNMVASTLYFVLTSLALLRAPQAWLALSLGAINVLAMTLVGEVVSKMLSARYRVEISRLVAPWGVWLFRALLPVIEFVEAVVIAPLARVLMPARQEEGLRSEELDALVSLGTREGSIDAGEQRVLAQVIKLGSLRVRDVMTPRQEVQWLHASAPAREVEDLVRAHALTRVPVCPAGAEGLDDGVLGMLDVKRYLASRALGRPLEIEDCLDAVRYVPERASLDKLLELFRSTGAKQGLAVSEHGAVTGIISALDVAKRLVTDIRDDDLREAGLEGVRMVAPGVWEVPGRLPVRDWAEMFGVRMNGRVSTVAGLIFARVGRVPRAGDAVTLGNMRLEVLEVVGRVAQKVRVSLAGAPAKEARA